MIKSKTILILFIFSISNLFSQNNQFQNSGNNTDVKISYLDSLKKTFNHDEMASKVDNLWAKKLANQKEDENLFTDIQNIDPNLTVDFELPTELLKERLKLLDEKSPFNIEYSQGLENVIKSFLKNRKHSFERLMGISQYYFPMFEEAMAKYNVPLEIKYLAVVESALNPKAVSRCGATGLWQFMFQTGKQYKLDINSYVDERSDALKSSDAAARYMKSMYDIFGDWDLVLASYNSGPGNVSKAIRRSGGLQNYWNIRKKLPRETQGYVPAFLATMYIFEYHKEHGIKPEKPIVNDFATDTILIKNKMTFKQISDLLDISDSEIEFLNPSYKLKVVPYVTSKKHFLRLPKDKIAVFTSNEDKMYAYANYEFNKREKPFSKPRVVKDTLLLLANNEIRKTLPSEITKVNKIVSKTKIHKVKSGDNLSSIADNYNVSMSDVKKWNKLKSNTVQIGRKLKIIASEMVTVIIKKPSSKAPMLEENKTNIELDNQVVSSDKSPDLQKKESPTLTTKEVKPNTLTEKAININEYIVKAGDNLYSIARDNKITENDLKKWNNLTDNNSIYAGDKLKINGESQSNKEVAYTAETTKIIHYSVKKGDNISEIALKNNITIDDLKLWNSLKDNTVKVGQKLKIQKNTEVIADNLYKDSKSKSKYKETKVYTVQKGDSLFIISQKHPGVTIANIKTWNDLKDENIKPGMKLKING
jgi:membrane-bound lytic murein transglycosylase D